MSMSSLLSTLPASTPPNTTPSTSASFGRHDLIFHLMPIWEAINERPEALAFSVPVSGIPNYRRRIDKPMDLSTIRIKLLRSEYADAWDFIDDVWLMFNNAWFFNKPGSAMDRYTTALAEIFEMLIEQKMDELGYCCGSEYRFSPKALTCAAKEGCTIPIGGPYFCYKRLKYCVKCFQKLPDMIECDIDTGDDMFVMKAVHKCRFSRCKNDVFDPEPFVKCVKCGRRHHRICVLDLTNLSSKSESFECNQCVEKEVSQWKLRASDLPSTNLSYWIEQRVSNYLAGEKVPATVHIRVVASTKNCVEVKPEMRHRFKKMPSSLPYQSKSIFAFVDQGDADVCFFGMHVQEYGDCPPPNGGSVYIAYVDSVQYFKPEAYRTPVYHEIILGYLEHVKKLGYSMAHIWGCPATEAASDYIFHAHPPEQKMPKVDRLIEWYTSLLQKGVAQGVVNEFKNLVEYVKETGITCASQLPYFEGDYWPETLETLIEEEEQEKLSKTQKRKNTLIPSKNLWAKVMDKMEEYKKVFLVVRLNNNTKLIEDPDVLIECELIRNRDYFVDKSRRMHYEFSSERRAKFSTMAIIYRILRQLAGKNPNPKKVQKEKVSSSVGGNEERMDAQVQGATPAPLSDTNRQLLDALVHSFECLQENCPVSRCAEWKGCCDHYLDCTMRQSHGCTACYNLVAFICLHAKDCTQENCHVANCALVKTRALELAKAKRN